jgi:hypothetical protein
MNNATGAFRCRHMVARFDADYVPRAHDAGAGGGRIGKFFDIGRGQKSEVRS